MEQQWKRDRKGREIYSSNTDSVKLSCSLEVRRRKVFSVCDGQRAPSVSPYLILQFDARAQEAFYALGKHVSAILQYVSIRGQKFHLPFNELARAAIDVHCLLFNRPFHWRVTSFPRVVTLPRAFLSHLVSDCSFSFVLKQGYWENSLVLGKKVLISLFYCDLSNGQIYRILVWNVSIVLHCSLFTSANSLTQATIKYR